jgi:bifunctional non-homologous end joining protein LigD
VPHPRKDAPLSAYREKRSAERTSEPFDAGEPTSGASIFVVHKHAARRLHYDLRLEMAGVLRSWAVPKGPSLDPAERRFAAEVEDHPLPYADFEGVIPSGSYGAGPSIVWDRGVWLPAEDPEDGYRRGKLLFTLRGYKLRGDWELVRMKKEKEWLLFKKKDAHASKEDAFPEGSVVSGLLVEELAKADERARALADEALRLGAARRTLAARDVVPMLAETREGPFSAKGWLFEPKLDGYRAIAGVAGRKASLVYRGGGDAAETFPEISRALAGLPFSSAVLDGEIVILDAKGRPVFQKLQKRGMLTGRADRTRASNESPATLYVFDLLGLEDADVRSLPLTERKALLQRVVPEVGPLRLVSSVPELGEELYEAAVQLGFEGIVAKKADSPYRPGRSSAWLKVRTARTEDFAVVGYTLPKETRAGFGALHLAIRREGALVYAGRVGTGFREDELTDVRALLDRALLAKPPCGGAPPKGSEHRWVTPSLVCEVRYKEWTEEALLRQPVFLRFRDDKTIEECTAELAALDDPEPPAPVPAAPARAEKRTDLTNTTKVFWPDEGYTKGDLLAYYRAIAPFLLPYLKDRPLVLTRYPDGIAGKSFFQKEAPVYARGFVRTEKVFSEENARDIDHFVVDDVESLLYVANLGAIPLHVFGSRVTSLPLPDWCILDLDPKTAPFADVVTIAKELHALCEEIGLPSFVKTSGSTGLHVLVPLGTLLTYHECRVLAELLARIVVGRLPEIATIARLPASRGGKVYVDTLQNGHGKLLVAPFSARPLPGAPVSMPLTWDEVNATLDLKKHTIANAPARMERKGDPLAPVLTLTPDLKGALERLARRGAVGPG